MEVEQEAWMDGAGGRWRTGGGGREGESTGQFCAFAFLFHRYTLASSDLSVVLGFSALFL